MIGTSPQYMNLGLPSCTPFGIQPIIVCALASARLLCGNYLCRTYSGKFHLLPCTKELDHLAFNHKLQFYPRTEAAILRNPEILTGLRRARDIFSLSHQLNVSSTCHHLADIIIKQELDQQSKIQVQMVFKNRRYLLLSSNS